MKGLVVAALLSLGVLYGVNQLAPGSLSYDTAWAESKPAEVVAVQVPRGIDWPNNCYRPDAQDRRMAACQALQNAGFNKDGIQMMLAISQGESGINLNALGDEQLANSKWGNSRGPWQIRSLNAEKGTGKCRDEMALISNGWDFHAKCAFEISGHGTNYKPWTIFLNRSYVQFL